MKRKKMYALLVALILVFSSFSMVYAEEKMNQLSRKLMEKIVLLVRKKLFKTKLPMLK